MDRCRTETPPLAPLPGQGGRLAACWLQEPGVPPPPELGLADPGLGRSPAQARPTAAGQNPPPAADGAGSAADGAAPPVPASTAKSPPEPAPVAAPTAAAAVAENLGARDD
jgi:hypothetical protein